MKTLEEMGIGSEDWKVSDAIREEMGMNIYSHHNEDVLYRTVDRGGHVSMPIRRENKSDIPVSPSEEETIALLKDYAKRIGFNYVPR